MPIIYSLLVTLSLILSISGCQTQSDAHEKSSPDTASTGLSVAMAFLEGGQPDKAMFELRSILESEPNNALAHNLMGLAQLALRNPKKAATHLEKAWTLERTSPHALNLSSAYIESNRLNDALKTITAGLSLKESKPYKNKERFYHNLGLIAEKKGSLVAAEKSYRKALEENPTFYLSRSKLAQILEERKKYEQAKTEWEAARSACPGCFEPVEHLVNYYEKKGDIKTAHGIILDYRKIEGIHLADSKKAADIEARLSEARMKAARDLNSSIKNEVTR
jgi:Tfp pilus assembly protein PilF